MTTKCRTLILAVLGLSVALAGEDAHAQGGLGQCSDSTTVIYFWNGYPTDNPPVPFYRLDGNTIRTRAKTTIVGNWYGYWQLYVSSWLYRDGTQIGSFIGDQAPLPYGSPIERIYTVLVQRELE